MSGYSASRARWVRMGTADAGGGILPNWSVTRTVCSATGQNADGGGICVRSIWSVADCGFGRDFELLSQIFKHGAPDPSESSPLPRIALSWLATNESTTATLAGASLVWPVDARGASSTHALTIPAATENTHNNSTTNAVVRLRWAVEKTFMSIGNADNSCYAQSEFSN